MALPSLLTAALAASLTVQPGESWLFRIANGQPVAAQRVRPNAAPAPGEIKLDREAHAGDDADADQQQPRRLHLSRDARSAATARRSSPRAASSRRNNRLAMESWPQVAVAVRVSDFKPTRDANCR